MFRSRHGGIRVFGFAHLVAVAALVGGFMLGGTQSLVIVALLGVLEIAVSFDNAIVNATVLARMDRYWQRMFMTVGVLIAAIGMRLVLPLAIVSVGARMAPWRAVDLAYSNPDRYHQLLLTAQPGIAAFGGIFLLMIAISFFREEREVHWWPAVERRLPDLLGRRGVPVVLALLFTAVAVVTVGHPWKRVLIGALVGLVCYAGVHKISEHVAGRADADGVSRPRTTVQGRSAMLLFVYLELLDATFSMDSVMGGFSVTVDIALITLGLAIGAAYIRALTVYVVRKGTLDQYRYLEHGAYYSIALLSVLLLWEVWQDVPDWLTASAGGLVIVAAYLTSVWAAKRTPEAPGDHPELDPVYATVQHLRSSQGSEPDGSARGRDTGDSEDDLYKHEPPVAS